MNYILHFHDSEVAVALLQGQELVLKFSAAHVRRQPDAQTPDGAETGFAKSVELAFLQPHWSGNLPDCLGRLLQGQVSCGARSRGSSLPIPLQADGPVRGEFAFHNGALLSLTALAVNCRFSDDPCFVESYAC